MNDLLCRIATRFVTASAEGVHDLVAASLRDVAARLGVESAAFRHGADAFQGPSTVRVLGDDRSWFGRTETFPDLLGREAFRRDGLASVAVVPVVVRRKGGDTRPVLVFGSVRAAYDWTAETREQLGLLAAVVGQALTAAAPPRVEWRNDGGPLRGAPPSTGPGEAAQAAWLRGRGTIELRSAAVRQALEDVALVAATPSTVLLLGETGVGKEVFAREIHARSARRQHPMVSVNCAALPGTLLESELFGRERGAFTGADSRQIGRFEAAHQSTIFLDEIGELSAEAQVKLLRVLQEHVIERLGSNVAVPVDVRVITATNRDLARAVAEGAFREDLFYRLNVFPITVPPLRDRPEDIEPLACHFVEEIAARQRKTITSMCPISMQALRAYGWPGNVRELRNVIERAVILATGPQLTVALPNDTRRQPRGTAAMTLDEVVADHIRTTVKSTGGRIRGRGGAAERLGLKPTTLETRMAKLGISRRSLTA